MGCGGSDDIGEPADTSDVQGDGVSDVGDSPDTDVVPDVDGDSDTPDVAPELDSAGTDADDTTETDVADAGDADAQDVAVEDAHDVAETGVEDVLDADVTPVVPATCVSTFTDFTGGSIRTSLERDAAGRVVRELVEEDEDTDETITVYDADGRILTEERTRLEAGVLRDRRLDTRTYTEPAPSMAGEFRRIEDADGDGEWDEERELILASNGAELEVREYVDGVLQRELHQRYFVVSSMVTLEDTNGDGSLESQTTFEGPVDAPTRAVTVFNSGVEPTVRTLVWDAEGRLLSFARDENNDGSEDFRETFSYPAPGAVEKTVYRDGLSYPNFVELRTRGADGRETALWRFGTSPCEVSDSVFTDGAVRASTVERRYPATGPEDCWDRFQTAPETGFASRSEQSSSSCGVLSTERDVNGDGAADYTSTISYFPNCRVESDFLFDVAEGIPTPTAQRQGAQRVDDAGREIQYSLESFSTRYSGRLVETSYDADGNPVEIRDEDIFDDGTSNVLTTTYTWDDQGRLLSQREAFVDFEGERVDTTVSEYSATWPVSRCWTRDE